MQPARAGTILTLGLVLTLIGACDGPSDPGTHPAHGGATHGAAAILAGTTRDTVWWVRMAGTNVASVCLGPHVAALDGTHLRPWVLTCALPGGPEPLSCLSGFLAADGEDPLSVAGETFQLELRPEPGRSWGSVESSDQIRAELFGVE